MKVSWEFTKGLLWVLFFCLIGATIMTYFTCTACHNSVQLYASVSLVSTSFWFAMWFGNSMLGDFTSRKIPWTERPQARLIVGILGTAVYSVGAVLFLTYFWGLFFGNWFGDYFTIAITALLITFFISLAVHSRQFLINWKKTLIDAEKFQRESIQAKYESLKSQVNPHFLFNSLNALTNLVYENPDRAAKFIKQLSEVYRYVLDTRDKEVVSLEEELKFLESYLFLQKIRFGDKLHVVIQLDGVKSSVAPLALQMLIENAIKHNVISGENPLYIKLYTANSFLVVENNLKRKAVIEEESPGLGLENIRSRYGFLSKEKVEVQEVDEKFIVRLPVLKLIE